MKSTRSVSKLMLAAAMASMSVYVGGGRPINTFLRSEVHSEGFKPEHFKREPKPRKVWYTVDSPEVIAATKLFKEKHSNETK